MGESGGENALEERKERIKATIAPLTKLDSLEKTGVSHGSNTAPVDKKGGEKATSSYRCPLNVLLMFSLLQILLSLIYIYIYIITITQRN